MQGRRSFWAWGLETDEPTDAQREETAARLSQRWGREISAPPLPKIEDIQLRPPRVSPPGPLAAICTTETHDRAAHSYGKSYRDTIRAVRGQFPNPPDVVAYPRTEAEVVAVMEWCDSGNIVAIRPLRDGVISDFDVTEQMLHYFIDKVHHRMLLRVPRPRVVVGIPSGVTEVEKRAVYDATISAGAREAYLIEEPMAAAIGASLPVAEALGSMIVDIGGGTTEVAVTSLGGIVVARSIRVAGDEMNEDIINYAKQKYNLLIGEQMAERVKIEAGSAYPLDPEITVELRGRNLVSGLPRQADITSVECAEAAEEPLHALIEGLHSVIERIPAELANDVFDDGILLTGGGAQLRSLREVIEREMQIPVFVADHPQECIALGCALVLERPGEYARMLGEARRGR